jgi:hypothetical protein
LSAIEIDFREFKERYVEHPVIFWEYIRDEDEGIFQQKIKSYLDSVTHNLIVWKKRPRPKKIFPHPQKEQFGYGDVVVPFTCVLCAVMLPPSNIRAERQ